MINEPVHIEIDRDNLALPMQTEEKSVLKIDQPVMLINSPFNSHSELLFEPGSTPHVYEAEDNDLPIFRSYSVHNLYRNNPGRQHHRHRATFSKNPLIKDIQEQIQDVVSKRIKMDRSGLQNCFLLCNNGSANYAPSQFARNNLPRADSNAESVHNNKIIQDGADPAAKKNKVVQSSKNFVKTILNWVVAYGVSEEAMPILMMLFRGDGKELSSFTTNLLLHKESYTLRELRSLCYEKEFSNAFRVMLIHYLETKFEARLMKSRVGKDLHACYQQLKNNLIIRLKSNDAQLLSNLK